MIYNIWLKPVLDFVSGIILLILLSPIIIVIGIILLFANKGNVIFSQKRPGKSEKIFCLLKFKTMDEKKDNNGILLPDDKRLTRVGKFLRRTSLDELPQLINVIKGDMSLIGPRPLLCEYLPLYNDFQKKRHDVKPGITGWAQINGRNAISWQEKFKFDAWYVQNISFILDLKIIILTIKKVFKSEGINSNTSATMEKFNGN